MKYIKPALRVELAQAAQMLAESLPISDTPVDGGNALTKENDWDLWSDDEEQPHPGLTPNPSPKGEGDFKGEGRMDGYKIKYRTKEGQFQVGLPLFGFIDFRP